MITNINYTRDAAEIKKAYAFSEHCYKVFIQNGFLPYRSGSGMFEKLPDRTGDLNNLFTKLKDVFDPQNILAPGKYRI
jgi:4-cresol dehydrogenase (hydroxylating)